MKKWINILLLVVVALISIWCTGDLMRKNDQAVILAGSYDLAHGRTQDWSAYYQVDKTYVLYWTCAALFKTQQLIRCAADPVAATNMGLALIFWFALTVFVVRFRRTLSPVVFLCFLTAPAILLNTLYVNSSVLSSAFLLLSAVFLFSEGRRNEWLAALCFFLAVGSRADVILLLPLLLWLITPFPRIGTFFRNFSKGWKLGVRGIMDFSNVWKLCCAGALALWAGQLICRGGGAAVDPIFNWKMVVGYTVFGFGAAGLLFVIYAIRLAAQALKGRGAFERIYGVAGLLVFLLPVLFFLPQLHAPRYFWRGCEAVLLLAVSARLPVWNIRPLKIIVVSTALLPMIVGVQLSSLSRPRMALTNPTLFPSGDGFYPMGGALPFMFSLRNASFNPVDHNQMVWRAAQRAEFQSDSSGTVPVLNTGMSGYLLFGASLQGQTVRRAPFEALCGSPFYSDSRSLMRDDPKSPIGALSQILALPADFVSPVSGGIGVLRFGEGDDHWGKQTQLLNRLFAGNEYRISVSSSLPDEMRRRVCFSKIPFKGSEMDVTSGLYYSAGIGSWGPSEGACAETVLPRWMSLQAFGSDQ